MSKTRKSLSGALVVAFLTAACGTEEQSIGSSESLPPSTPSTSTIADGEVPVVGEVSDPAIVIPTTRKAEDVPADTVPMEVSDGSATLEELVEESSAIVVGEVADIVSLGRPSIAEDEYADEMTGVTLKVSSVLKGDSLSEVRLAWDTYLVDPRGVRTAVIVANGLKPPVMSDTVLLFLIPADDSWTKFNDGFPTHMPVRLDGVAYLNNGKVTAVETGSPAGEQIIGQSVDAVQTLIADLVARSSG